MSTSRRHQILLKACLFLPTLKVLIERTRRNCGGFCIRR
ncbi:hypothetical protein RND81_05G153100 [Saponaria officinalis]|uniref:Uncharacterized protein n=1 Tax=Saponaria officinalis TaxID=3572 RepID=A0AAW1KYC0_SAPOF